MKPLDKGGLGAAHASLSAGQWHSDKDLLRSDTRNPCFGRLPEAGGLILGSVRYQAVDRLSHLDLGCFDSRL